MEFFDLVNGRQSVRAYASQPIEDEKLQKILEATNRAPSAGNFQSFEIYVVADEAKRKIVADATFDQKFIVQAPVSLIFGMNPARCQYQPAELYAMQDTTIACTFAMLAAHALGLSTCWIGAFIPAKVAAAAGLPDGITPVAILPIGYPAEQPERTSRRELSDIVHSL